MRLVTRSDFDGLACATASMSVLRRPNLVGLPSAEQAGREAYEMAGIGIGQVELDGRFRAMFGEAAAAGRDAGSLLPF